jgi:hypothetical protein
MSSSSIPPVTDDVIRWHLSGTLRVSRSWLACHRCSDETCFVLAVDFDKTGWRMLGLLDACRLDLPTALERSRSGRWAHVWFFFEDAIPAALARRLGSHVRWKVGPTSAWIRTTDSFPIRTRCRREDSGT